MLALLLLMTGCQWYTPELQACRQDTYCPEGFECVLAEADDVGVCSRRSGGTFDDDDAADDDDTSDGGILVLEQPSAGATVWVDEDLQVRAWIAFPDGATDRSVHWSLDDRELLYEDDASGLVHWDPGSSVWSTWFSTIGWGTGADELRIVVRWDGFEESAAVAIQKNDLPDGWRDADGDSWCPGEGSPPGSGTPGGVGGRDDDRDGVCDSEERAVPAFFDCNDSEPIDNPEAAESCDGRDNDCDGAIPADEVDADGDLHRACLDCDDGDSTIHPAAQETCDGQDEDCDGLIDENGDPDDENEASAEDFLLIDTLTRTSLTLSPTCPDPSLPTCLAGGAELCALRAEQHAAFSSPDDPLDAFGFTFANGSPFGAEGCPTIVTVTPSVGQDLNVTLYMLQSDSDPISAWTTPVPMVEGAAGVWTGTLDEADPAFGGLVFGGRTFVLDVRAANGTEQCPTDGYDILVEGY